MHRNLLLALGMFALGLVLIATSAVGRQNTTPLPDSSVLDTATVWSGRVAKLGFAIEPPYRWTNMFGDSVRVNGIALDPGLTTLVDTTATIPVSPRLRNIGELIDSVQAIERYELQRSSSRERIVFLVDSLLTADLTHNQNSWLLRVTPNYKDGSVWIRLKPEKKADSLLIELPLAQPSRPRADPHRVHRSVMQGYVRELRAGTILVFGQHEDCFVARQRDMYYADVDGVVRGSLVARDRLRGQYPDDVPDWVYDQLEHPVNLSFFVR